METVWVIYEVQFRGADGREVHHEIKRVFDYESEANAAVFPPFKVKAMEVDTKDELLKLHNELSPIQLYSVNCYNELGIKNYLINGDAE